MWVECSTVSRESSLSLIVEFDKQFSLIFQYGHILFHMEKVLSSIFFLQFLIISFLINAGYLFYYLCSDLRMGKFILRSNSTLCPHMELHKEIRIQKEG